MAVTPWHRPIWEAHQRTRWAWADHALDDAYEWLTGRRTDRTSRHVTAMLVGDSTAGKTSLAVRALGVTRTEDELAVHEVLRAGRDVAISSTSIPLRYGWSGDEEGELWEITDDGRTTSLTDDELMKLLAGYRGQGGDVRWDMESPPLTIGIPRKFGYREQAVGVEVLDIPGLYAESPTEQALARRLVDRYAPTVGRIAFVESANKMHSALNDPAITGNHHLADWTDNPERYLFIFTRALKDSNALKTLRAMPADASEKAVLDELREWQISELAKTHTLPDPDLFRNRCFPVELGGSWQSFPSNFPDAFEMAARVNSESVRQLLSALESGADEASFYRAAMGVRTRVAIRIRRSETRRTERLNESARRIQAAQQVYDQAEHSLVARKTEKHEAARALRTWKAAVSTLEGRTLAAPIGLPASGGVPSLLDRQVDEKNHYAQSARDTWERWYDRTTAELRPSLPPVGPVIPVTATAVRNKYQELLSCRAICSSWWCSPRAPESGCYRRMVTTGEKTSTWVINEFVRHARQATPVLENQHATAGRAAESATKIAGLRRADLIGEQNGAHDVEREVAEERSRDQESLAVVNGLAGDLHAANHAAVTAMIATLPGLAVHDRIATAVAALQLLMDFDTLVGTR